MATMSLLSSLFAARTVSECKTDTTLQQVFGLFEPMLTEISAEKGCSLQQVLTDMFSSFIMHEKSKLTKYIDMNGNRKELEQMATQYYQYGDLESLPNDIISNCVSYLQFDDRLSMELSCKHLFTLSRNTPVYYRQFYDRCGVTALKTHCVIPIDLSFSGISEELLKNIQTQSIEKISLPWRNRSKILSWLLSQQFPKLQCIDFNQESIRDGDDERLFCSFIDQSRVSKLLISDCTFDVNTDGFMDKLSNCKHVNHVEFSVTDSDDIFPSDQHNDLDFNHIKSMEFEQCFSCFKSLNTIIHPGLQRLMVEVVDYDHDEDEQYQFDLNDFKFLNLPNVVDLDMDFRERLAFDELGSVLDRYAPTWSALKHFTLKVDCSFQQIFELLDYLSNSSVGKLTINITSVTESIGEDGTKTSLTDALNSFPQLKELIIHVHRWQIKKPMQWHDLMSEAMRISFDGKIKIKVDSSSMFF